MTRFKERVFNIIRDDENTKSGNIFDGFIISLIIINVLLVILDTFKLSELLRNIASFVEVFSVVVFTIEYILRLWTADCLNHELGRVKATIKFLFSFMALIDLFAILPFYIPFIIQVDLGVLRTLRIVRLIRLFKVNRYTTALEYIVNVFKRKSSQLISSVFVVFLLMVVSSVLMYNFENYAQPETFKNAFSGLWWSIATFTTVGYGDIYPITVAGKVLSGIIAVLGIALVAVPTGIISAGFIEQIEKNRNEEKIERKQFCPYCGNKIDR